MVSSSRSDRKIATLARAFRYEDEEGIRPSQPVCDRGERPTQLPRCRACYRGSTEADLLYKMPSTPAPLFLFGIPTMLLPLLFTSRYSALTFTSSVLLRILSFLFLRVIPAPFGPVLSPPFYLLYLIGWWKLDGKLHEVERMMGKDGGGVFGQQKEKLEEWQKIEKGEVPALNGNGTETVKVEAEVGQEVIEAAKQRAKESEKEDSEAKEAPASPSQTKTYAQVAAEPPSPSSKQTTEPASAPESSPPTTNGDLTEPEVDSDVATPISSSSRSPPLTHSTKTLLPHKLFSSLLSIPFGAPSRSRVINRLSLLINSLLLFSCLDATFRPLLPLSSSQVEDLAFVRIGATGEEWVKVAARIPPLLRPTQHHSSKLIDLVSKVGVESKEEEEDVKTTVERIVGAKVIYRPTQPVGKWIVGPLIEVEEERDWTGVVKVDNLFPGTEYECASTCSRASALCLRALMLESGRRTDRLTLPDSPASHHPAFPEVGYFKTFPDHRLSTASVFTFGTSSCIKGASPESLGHCTGPEADLRCGVAKPVSRTIL